MYVTQRIATRFAPQLQARSAWAWPQVLVWLFLGGALLNLPPLFGAMIGLGGYGLVGLAAQGREHFNAAGQSQARLAAAKWGLSAVTFGLCVLAGVKPDFVNHAAGLALLFRPSSAFPSTTFYGGWSGEPIIISGLLLVAFGQAILNELNFANDGLGGAKFDPDRSLDRATVLRGLAGSMLMVGVAVLVLLMAGMGGDTGPRGHLFDAQLGPIWAFGWWAALSFLLLGMRFVRLAAASLALLARPRAP